MNNYTGEQMLVLARYMAVDEEDIDQALQLRLTQTKLLAFGRRKIAKDAALAGIVDQLLP